MRRRKPRGNGSAELFQYHRVSELVADASQIPEQWQNANHDTPLSYSEILHRMTTGDLRHVEPAKRLIEDITTSENFDAKRSTWLPAISGAYPSIPDYLSGRPDSMRRQTRVQSQGVPIGLWVDVISSAGVSLENLQRRGIAVLALGMHLQRFRPVQLHVMATTMSQGGVCLDLETTPFDISVASDFLCNGETARLPMYAIIRNATNDWVGSMVTDVDYLRKCWDIPEGDLVLCGTHLNDRHMIDNPVQWINETAQRLSTV